MEAKAICELCDNVKNNKNNNDDSLFEIGRDNNNIGGGNAVENFQNDLNKMKKAQMPYYRPIDISELRISLFKSIIMPEYAKGIRFPAPYSIPSML